MCRRLSTAAVLLALVYLAAGCAGQSRSLIRTKSLSSLEGEKIVQVTLTSGEVVRFSSSGGHYYDEHRGQARVITGRTEAGNLIAIPIIQVQEALIERVVDEEAHVDVFPALIITGLAVAVIANGQQK